MLKLILDSDLHFKDGEIRIDKVRHIEKIREVHRRENVDAVLCMGDLTESGTDGTVCKCWPFGKKTDDQVTPLRQFIGEIENGVGIKTYIVAGNHDEYVPWPYLHKGVFDLVKERHGGLMYYATMWRQERDEIEITKYLFIFLGKYPNSKAVKYLEDILENSQPDQNVIIGFHYNVEGQWSDWWKDDEKEKFLKSIEPYRPQIRLIVVGHRHQNYKLSWHGYTVVSGAGSDVVLCKINPRDNFKVSIEEIY